MAWELCENPRLALVTTPGDLDSTITPAAARHECAPLHSEVRASRQACLDDALLHYDCFIGAGILHLSFVRGRLCRREAISAVPIMMYATATSALIKHRLDHSAEAGSTTKCMCYHECSPLGSRIVFCFPMIAGRLRGPPWTAPAYFDITCVSDRENHQPLKAILFKTQPNHLQKRLPSSGRLSYTRNCAS